MRVALIAPPWNPIPPSKYGGSESMVDGLARALKRAGEDVHLFALVGSTCDVPTTIIPYGSQPWAFSPVCHELGYVVTAYSQLEGFDVVHDNTTFGPLYAQGVKDVPVVTTNHGPFEGDLNTLYNTAAPWCPVVAISHSQARTAQVPYEMVHHGVDADYFTYGEGGGDDNGEYYLFLGRMSATKGPHLAAQAARDAGKRLVIAAKMQEEAEFDFFKKNVEPLLGDGVEFIGEVGGSDKRRLLQDAVALVNPITWPEPFGLVMTEALACGTPVITTNRGAAPEIVEHGVTGIVCDSDDDIASAFDKVRDLDRKAARRSVEDYFNIDRMAADYVKVYEKAIANHL